LKNHTVSIIGAGPAGIAAAIQLKRYDINPVIFEKETIGGLLKNANLIENYPGFPDGISSTNLIKLFKKHLKNSNIKIEYEKIFELNYKHDFFILKTLKKTITSPVVIIASGTKPIKITDFSFPDEIKNKIYYDIYPLLKICFICTLCNPWLRRSGTTPGTIMNIDRTISMKSIHNILTCLENSIIYIQNGLYY